MSRLLPRQPGPPAGRGQHPDWCARGHTCGLGEHRARSVTLAVKGRASVILTRVMGTDGREHAEIRTSIALAPGEQAARVHLAHILTELETHLRRVVRQPRT